MSRNKSKITYIFLFVLYLALPAGSSFGQGICEVKSFRLDKIKGKVVADGPKGFEPITQAKVELWDIGGEDEDNKLVASTSSDVNGLFEVSNIKKGWYRLEISKWESGFVLNFAAIKVVKKVKESERGKQLVFRLGVESLKPCGGGDVSLVPE